eukprot:scaffold18438_cov61-Phaeocystis_antarctica.AAC.6
MPQSEPAGQEQMASVQQARWALPIARHVHGFWLKHGVHLADLAARRLLTNLLPADQPRRLCPQQACETSPPRDIPQPPSSQLVAVEELSVDSIKDDAQIAPAQATPQPPVPRQHHG